MNFHQTSRKKYVPAVHLQGVLKLNSLKLTPTPKPPTTRQAPANHWAVPAKRAVHPTTCQEAYNHPPGVNMGPVSGGKKHIQTWWTFPTPPPKKKRLKGILRISWNHDFFVENEATSDFLRGARF